jgi:hypothetical protein
VEGRLLLDVVVGERAAVLELLAREDKTLLIGGDACSVANFLNTSSNKQKRHHVWPKTTSVNVCIKCHITSEFTTYPPCPESWP